MTDVLTAKQRKYCMSQIRSKNTKPELRLRKALWTKGLRYRVRSQLFGQPDIIFPSLKLAIFVDGCFWHGCPVHSQIPKTNSSFWKAKIDGNIVRDQLVNIKLEKQGWQVLRFWTHEIKSSLDLVVEDIERTIHKLKE